MRTNRLGIVVLVLAPSVGLAVNDCERYAESPLQRALVKTESSGNPFAIGVVGGHLARQPHNLQEAIATAQSLDALGFNYSVGCRQINKSNFTLYGLSLKTAFDPEINSRSGSEHFAKCEYRARNSQQFGNNDANLRAALSCYNSGNFISGQRKEGYEPSYADKVLANMASKEPGATLAIRVIPTKPKDVNAGGGKGLPPAPSQIPPAESKTPADWDAFNEL